jgi:hypothetical protein
MVFYGESKGKKETRRYRTLMKIITVYVYFLPDFASCRCRRTAWAAASRATGTLYGEQDT